MTLSDIMLSKVGAKVLVLPGARSGGGFAAPEPGTIVKVSEGIIDDDGDVEVITLGGAYRWSLPQYLEIVEGESDAAPADDSAEPSKPAVKRAALLHAWAATAPAGYWTGDLLKVEGRLAAFLEALDVEVTG